MKIALSALLAAGACQLASAVVPDRQFTVSVVPSLNGPYMACISTDTCDFGCVDFTINGEGHSTRRNTESCPDQTQYSSTIAIPKEDDETKLAYLMTDDSLSPVGCAYVGIGLGTNNDYYYCPPRQIITTTATTTTTTTATVTTTATAAPTCANKSVIYDKKKGNGYKGDCCKTEADCRDDCVKGKCNGPSRATTKTTTTTTSKPSATPACKSGYRGKKKGNGSKNACCSTERDCKEDCVKGKCT